MRRFLPTLLLLALIVPCAAAAHEHVAAPANADCTSPNAAVWKLPTPRTSLVRWLVKGAKPDVQRCIDRGVAMLYGFSVGQAREDFARANALQAASPAGPELALPYWGIAESWTIDINLPFSTPDNELLAAKAAQKAAELSEAPGTDPETRALAQAAVLRFPMPPDTTSPAPAPTPSPDPCIADNIINQQFSAYAHALDDYVSQNSASANAYVVAGFAWYTMEQNPVVPCTKLASKKSAAKRSARALTFAGIEDAPAPAPTLCPRTDKAILDADAGIKRDPDNPGPHHLGVHARETCGLSHTPPAVDDANALTSYMYGPGLSHLPHMASHIYSRLGAYEEGIRSIIPANKRAVDNDHGYYDLGDGGGQQYLNRYHAHDIDFLLYAWTTIGHSAEAVHFVNTEYPNGRPLLSLMLRLHRTPPSPHPDQSIREPWRTRLGALSAARQGDSALALKVALKVAGTDPVLLPLVKSQLDVAAGPSGRAQAITDYGAAYCAQYYPSLPGCPSSLPPPSACNPVHANPGDPKDFWYVPIGEGYGKVLLQAGRYAEAAKVFTADACRFPNDPRLEYGAALAYRALGNVSQSRLWLKQSQMYWKGKAPLRLRDLG
ncbi:MAG: Tetratricopeptide repeat protein [Candidatus Eremiobacteraeota bacterium]|nr:Tetratricopeptide repeat protein [Candidatus Eremiobacteraeota bacterium]